MSGKLGLMSLGLILCLYAGCAINPITGQEELMLYPEQKDIAIGRNLAPEVEKELGGRIASENMQRYIDSVGQRIARVSHRPDLEYHFAALEHESINALALPGGYVFLTKGMLQNLTTEAQLAGILAHETAHVIARDSMAALSRKQAVDLLLIAVATQDTPAGAMRAAQLTRLFLDLSYSREDEQEADLAGLDYMVRAGYDPHGMIETMQMLQKKQESRPIEFFSTHPNPANRITYLRRRIQAKYSNLAGLKTGIENFNRGVLEHLPANKADQALEH